MWEQKFTRIDGFAGCFGSITCTLESAGFVFRSVVAGMAMAFLGAVGAAANCPTEVVWLRGDWGKATFSVEIAKTPQERARGLQEREYLPLMAGMLFLFESPGPVTFWMKNTPISLDILFVSETGTVTGIHREAVPFDPTLIRGGNDTIAVLELNGGISDRFGVAEGTEIRHPAFNQDLAAWPCSDGG